MDNQSSIEIPEGFKVVYDDDASLNLDIDENSYMAFSTQLLSGEDAILFSAEGYDDDGYEVKRQLSYSDGVFTYKVIGQIGVIASTTYTVTNRPSEYVWYNIFMPPLTETENGDYTAKLKVYEGKVINCIYPSEDLYPGEDFYPTFGNWDNLNQTSNDGGTEE